MLLKKTCRLRKRVNKEQAEPGPGRDREEREKQKQPPHGQALVTLLKSLVSKGRNITGGNNSSTGDIKFSPGACSLGCVREIICVVSTCHPCYGGYLLKKEVNWMKSQHVFSPLGDELCVV